ncbi:hypothetical protein OG539_19350 [Actinacidiphila glaucinigra]|uniref:hypothetical protein n=1 Tax=Actinacidiphila glaucinigra TaxID=235986 RepID=UPI002DDB102F|nr:hypothetical protein [Actinacidiphila glaucinigra]WSD61643.1 hypothetical protein OIE69_23425 [Actinacidiphila glaucinigra]
MSSTPEPAPDPATGPAAASSPRAPRDPAALVFDDPLDRQSSDDTDTGWGERPGQGGAGDLARFLDEKPPHHI